MPVTIPLLVIALLLTTWRDGPLQTTGGRLVTIVQEGPVGAVDSGSARISAHGGHVVFVSYARLSPQDTNHMRDVYVSDLSTGRLTLESAGARETAANG